jgi:hypothetical protein
VRPDDQEDDVRTRLVPVAVAIAACGAIPLAGLAGADTRAKTTVTIEVQGTEYHGTVSSPKPKRCAKDRKIVLYKQKGKVQDRSVDRKVGMDTASLNGGVYEWNTGNTGLYGKFYAWAGRTATCKADASPTIKNPKPS